ncbi:DNA replication and repair protein RadA [Alkalibacterium subtropicum]|uniref:DNA repair protein RadA n=1 Tax=Alkalibacterium subtropicum TaxID=753702 RepID=A0A1I1LEF9_9LACT|nr:DNA repair protein RadA [Alkalibacterium subtropicum]SFC71484.1 DNA replication and repair protein RadA [Alkalibacterium subtropicum]
MAKKKATVFVCQNCGYESPKYLGKCPSCGTWNQMVEEKLPDKSDSRSRVTMSGKASKAEPITDITIEKEERVKTRMVEFNRVLGGGVVPGSLVLIGGDPGIGKSTLLLQVSAQLNQQGGKVLYVSGEESAAQIKMRAERLELRGTDFYLYAETEVTAIQETIETLKPDYVIIDSIQTMHHANIDSASGSVSQVRESTSTLMQIAKMNEIAIFIVGHVTKEGAIAGPRMLEHMVDTVLYFEGEQHHTFRILRAVKNRFGSTNEIGIFEMKNGGLEEVLNPSQLFLEERLAGATGSAVVAAMEGTRPMLVEIQSLISPTVFGNAKRTSSGLDYSRVSLIMAVLEKRAGLLLQNQDAYLKAAGGVRLDEPAIDLSIAISIASSYKEKETRATDCFIGEIGLTGEIRSVSKIEQRVKEADKLGFKRVFIPKNNKEGWAMPKNIEVIGCTTLTEVIKRAFS